MEKRATIAEHRNEAAMVALQIACVALNDTEGLGYKRLSVFAKRLQELVAEYYEDPEASCVSVWHRSGVEAVGDEFCDRLCLTDS